MKPNIKDIFREIKNTITKFISIILIVGLGVFVLVGLLSTGDIMRGTLEKSIQSQKYPDIFISAPLGFETEDEYILENQDGISELEYGYDIEINIKNSPTLVRVMNMPTKLDMPMLVEGSYPKKDEILLDAKLKDRGYKIGDRIYFSHEKNKFRNSTDEDGKYALDQYDFKISGFAKSIDYIQDINRGYSQRGLGEISAFGYINPSVFNNERTICKIIYDDTSEYETSSKKYRRVLDERYNSLKIDMKFRPTDRLKSIKSKISKEILDGEDEISKAEEALIDGREEIDRNKDTLSEKEREYLEGLAKFKDEREKGNKELKKSKDELYKASIKLEDGSSKLASGYSELQEGKKTLDESKEKLEDGKKELSDSKIKYEKGKAQQEMGEEILNESEKQLEDGRKKLDEGWEKIDESKRKLEEGKIEYRNGLSEYLDGKEKLEEAKEKVINSLGISGLNYEEASSVINSLSLAVEKAKPLLEKYNILDREIKSSEERLNSLNDNLRDINNQIENAKNEEEKQSLQEKKNLISSNIIKEEQRLENLNKTRENLKKALDEINEALGPEYNISAIYELVEKLKIAKNGVAEINENEKKLVDAKAKLDSAKDTIERSQEQLSEGIREAEAGEKEYSESKNKFNQKKIEIENAKKELQDAKLKLDDGERKIKEAESKYNKGLKDYDKGYGEYLDKKSEYDKGKAKYDSGLEEYERGKDRFDSEIKNGENELIDANKRLNEGKNKLRDGENKYNKEKNDAEEKINDGRKEIKDAKKYLNLIKEPRYTITPRYLVNDLNAYLDYALRCDGLALIFPVFFFAIALLVCFTTMTRMVEEQRITIGTYKALGYFNNTIAFKFFLYGTIASLIGGIIGAISGSFILTYIIGNAYSTGSIFENQLIIRPFIIRIIFSISMGFVFTAIAAVFTAKKVLKENTASLLRAKPPKKGTRIFLERIKFIWNRLNFIQKVTARNIFRSKKRMIMTIIGIMGCCALLILGFGIEGSVRNISKLQFDEILKYDSAISFDKDIDEDSYNDYLGYLKKNKIKYGEIYEESMNVEYPQNDQNVELIATDNEEKFHEYIDLRNPNNQKEIKIPKRGAVITKKLAKLKNLKVGDILKIKDVYDNEFEIEVKDITEMYVGHYIFMNDEYFEKVMGKDFKINTHLIKKESTKKLDKLQRDVINYKSVVNVLSLNKMQNMLDQFIYPIKKVEMIIIIVSSLLAIVVLYNLTNINIEERKREIATIKVLGFYAKETTAYVYRETYILTIIGVALGLVIGKILHYLILQIVVPYEAMLSDYLVTSAYVKSFFITISITTLTMFIFHRKIKKINMVESLKSNE